MSWSRATTSRTPTTPSTSVKGSSPAGSLVAQEQPLRQLPGRPDRRVGQLDPVLLLARHGELGEVDRHLRRGGRPHLRSPEEGPRGADRAAPPISVAPRRGALLPSRRDRPLPCGARRQGRRPRAARRRAGRRARAAPGRRSTGTACSPRRTATGSLRRSGTGCVVDDTGPSLQPPHHGPGPRHRGRHLPGPGARRQHRRRARGRAPRAGPGPRPRRADAHAGLALGRDPGRRPDQGRPRPGPRRHDRRGRGGGARGRRAHGQRPDRPGARRRCGHCSSRAPPSSSSARRARASPPWSTRSPAGTSWRRASAGPTGAAGTRRRTASWSRWRAARCSSTRPASAGSASSRTRTRWTRRSRTSPSWPRACRFADCHHAGEPGCAIQAALDSGELAERRFDSWRRLAREAAYQARRSDARLRAEERDRWKKVTKEYQRGLRGPVARAPEAVAEAHRRPGSGTKTFRIRPSARQT